MPVASRAEKCAYPRQSLHKIIDDIKKLQTQIVCICKIIILQLLIRVNQKERLLLVKFL